MANQRQVFPDFANDAGPEMLGQKWTRWTERFSRHLVINDLEGEAEAARNKAKLINGFSEEVDEIYRSVRSPKDDDTLADLIEAITKRIVGDRSSYNEVFNFMAASRQSEESIDAYATRLRKLARNCEFGKLKELTAEQITDQLILWHLVPTCKRPELQRRYLMEAEPTLEKALKEASVLEALATNVAKFRDADAVIQLGQLKLT